MSENKNSKSIIRATSTVASLTLVSRFFGFIRDLIIARLFGASIFADSFFVAFKIPNLLRSFVAEGALSAAFVPIFAGELKNGKERAQEVVSLVLGFLSIITLSLTVAGIIFAENILILIAPGLMREESASLCISLTQIMMPYIICVSMVAMLNGALNSVNIFGVAALAQVAMNIVLIAGAILAGYFQEQNGVYILAWSVIAGGIVQVIIQIPALTKAGFKFIPKFNLFSAVIKSLVILMLPAILGATVYQITQFLNTLLATLLVTGSVSWLFYADRVTQLPIGIFSIALASVLLPSLAKANSESNQGEFANQLINSLRYTSFFMIPVAGTLYFFSAPFVITLFERGEFTRNDSLNTSAAVQAFTLGLWTISCYSMMSRAFIAKKDTVTPTVIGVITLFLSVSLSLLLMGKIVYNEPFVTVNLISSAQNYLYSIFPAWSLGHKGLALSSSLTSYFSLLLIILIFNSRYPGVAWSVFVISSAKALISSMLAFTICFLLGFSGHNSIFSLFVEVLFALSCYLLLAWLMRAKEALETVEFLKRKLKRK